MFWVLFQLLLWFSHFWILTNGFRICSPPSRKHVIVLSGMRIILTHSSWPIGVSRIFAFYAAIIIAATPWFFEEYERNKFVLRLQYALCSCWLLYCTHRGMNIQL